MCFCQITFNNNLFQSILLLFLLMGNSINFAQTHIIDVSSVSISNSYLEKYNGKALIARMQSVNNIRTIKVTINFIKNNSIYILQSDADKFSTRNCKNGYVKQQNEFMHRKNIFLCYGSGLFYLSHKKQNRQIRDRYISFHYFDPSSLILFLLNLSIVEGNTYMVTICVSRDVKWGLINQLLTSFELRRLIGESWLSTIKRELYLDDKTIIFDSIINNY